MLLRAFLAVLAALLTACAGPVPKLDVTKNQLAPLRTVAVVHPPEPKLYSVINLGHPGMAFGLIGGLVAAADFQSKQEQLSGSFRAEGAAFNAHLAEKVVMRLKAAGYSARLESAPWEQAGEGYKLTFEKIQSDADAVLVLTPTIVGFMAEGPAGDYQPTMAAVVRLLGPDRKEIYRGYHVSGWTPKADGWRATPPAKTFANFQALMDSPKASAATIDDAAAAVASSIQSDLQR